MPQSTALGLVTLGPATARDGSTASEDGTEHAFGVHVWSGARGQKQAHEVLGAVRAACYESPLRLVGHRPISLGHEHSETCRGRDGDTVQGLARFRCHRGAGQVWVDPGDTPQIARLPYVWPRSGRPVHARHTPDTGKTSERMAKPALARFKSLCAGRAPA
ncbi:MAG: DUF3168 domain-containing protein [Hyphomicrobiaceae bacterium]|nr:DUF3168 domain-containing protein [Hyphomicrobiaceae bacterium]